jgi:hypothetical protein
MNGPLQEIMDRQGGIFARHQALNAGCSEREFAWLTRERGGPWTRIRYGVYTERASWESKPSEARAAMLDRAALLVCDEGTVLSHSSAARLLGLPLYSADDGLAHVTRLRFHDRHLTRTRAGIKHHCGRLDDSEITWVDDLPVTTAERTVLDVASEFGYASGLVIADAALHRRVTRDQLTSALTRYPYDVHVRLRATVVSDADGRAETPIESLGRALLKDMGIEDVRPQHEVVLGDGTKVFVDLYSARLHHCFECDGRLKYRTQVNLRGDEVDADQIVWDEKMREDALRGAGFGVSRIVWKDTMPDAFSRASARLWREIRLQDAARMRSGAPRSA